MGICWGKGDGTFDADYFGAGWAATAAGAGDLNLDGQMDVVTANFSEHSLSVLLAKTPRDFVAPHYPAVVEATYHPLLVDVDADQRLDLITTLESRPSIYVFSGAGDGTFGPPVEYPVGYVARALASADFNHDGRVDLAVALYTNAFSILLNSGDGRFGPPMVHNLSHPSFELGVGDFNGDNHPDIAFAHAVLLGSGDGTFGEERTLGPDRRSIRVADLDNDGNLDLFVRGGIGFLGDGRGGFRSLTNAYDFGHSYDWQFGDLDEDGVLDMAVLTLDGTVEILKGNGDGTFAAPARSGSVAYAAGSLAIADVNGDAAPDLVAQTDHEVVVLAGNGTGSSRKPAGSVRQSFSPSAVWE